MARLQTIGAVGLRLGSGQEKQPNSASCGSWNRYNLTLHSNIWAPLRNGHGEKKHTFLGPITKSLPNRALEAYPGQFGKEIGEEIWEASLSPSSQSHRPAVDNSPASDRAKLKHALFPQPGLKLLLIARQVAAEATKEKTQSLRQDARTVDQWGIMLVSFTDVGL